MALRYPIIPLLLLAACSGSPELPEHLLEYEKVTAWPVGSEPRHDIRLVPEARFGSTEQHVVGNPGFLELDSDGRLFMGDQQQRRVHLFDSEGGYLRSLGQEGDGPGEFRAVGRLLYHDNHLYAFDFQQLRIQVFAPSPDAVQPYRFLKTIMIDASRVNTQTDQRMMPPALHHIRRDGTLLLHTRTSPITYRENPDATGISLYLPMDPETGRIGDPVFQQNEPEHIVTEWFTISTPFFPRDLMALLPDDRIIAMNTDELFVTVYSQDGSYESGFYHPMERRPLTREDAVTSIDQHEQLTQAVRRMSLPATWPVASRLMADDKNRIWVALPTDEPELVSWLLFDVQGVLLARFDWPEHHTIRLIRNGAMYVSQPDESGVREIVRYSIHLE